MSEPLENLVSVAMEGFGSSGRAEPLEDKVTIWLPRGYGEKWASAQKKSGNDLSKRARQVLMAIIDRAEKRAG